MIFVTVGTHEQQFDRLIKEVDGLKKIDISMKKCLSKLGLVGIFRSIVHIQNLFLIQK